MRIILPQSAVHTGSEQGALGEAQLYATALMERIRDTLRAERTFDFQARIGNPPPQRISWQGTHMHRNAEGHKCQSEQQGLRVVITSRTAILTEILHLIANVLRPLRSL